MASKLYLPPVKDAVKVSIGGRDRIKVGELIRIDVEAAVPGRLVIDINAEGKVTQISPNRFSAAAKTMAVTSEQKLTVPDTSHGFSGFRVAPPTGDSTLVGLVVPADFPVQSLVASEEQLASRNLVPEQGANYYYLNLLDQIRQKLAAEPASGMWGLSIFPYRIEPAD